MQDASRERDKEYQKLKVCCIVDLCQSDANVFILKAQHDKIKRKALLTSNSINSSALPFPGGAHLVNEKISTDERTMARARAAMPLGMSAANMNIGAVVGGMEANGVCSVPCLKRALLKLYFC
jgi:hypothetical protein